MERQGPGAALHCHRQDGGTPGLGLAEAAILCATELSSKHSPWGGWNSQLVQIITAINALFL